MKIVYYLGLIIFTVGIILFFLRQFNESFLSGINDRWIDLMWPIGLMMYSIGQIYIRKQKNSSD